MKKKIRVIVVSDEKGIREDIVFTDDFDVSAEDYCCYDQTVQIDKLIDDNLPMGFPTEFTLSVKK